MSDFKTPARNVVFMLLNVTLDNNSIIDLEENNEHAPHIQKLIHMHNKQEICLRVVAISASELKKDHTYYEKFDEFKQKLNTLGLGEAKILPTLGYADLSFSDYCAAHGRWLSELEKEIQTILFSKLEMEYKENKISWCKWVNHRCDVLGLWSHIWFNGDIFVTRDKHILSKVDNPQLIKLGVGKILRPICAVDMLDC